MLTNDEARRRVARGAAHLDQVRPGWHERIDVGTLTLHDPCGCIVGQLCELQSLGTWRAIGKPFEAGAASLFGATVNDWCEFGVNLRDAAMSSEAFRPLQDAWIEAIADRRLGVAAAQEMEQPASDAAVARTADVGTVWPRA